MSLLLSLVRHLFARVVLWFVFTFTGWRMHIRVACIGFQIQYCTILIRPSSCIANLQQHVFTENVY